MCNPSLANCHATAIRPLVTLVLACVCLLSAPCGGGPYPANVAGWDEAVKQAQRDAGAVLIARLKEAAAKGENQFVAPKGHYRFSKTERVGCRHVCIHLTDIRDLTIDCNGSTFWFEDEHQAIRLARCIGVTIRNLVMDWDPLGATQGTVVGTEPETKTVEVVLDPGYERVTPGFAALPAKGNAKPYVRAAVFDADGRFKPDQQGCRVVPFFQTPKQEGRYRISVLMFYGVPLEELNVAVGDRMAFWVRGQGALLCEGCENLLLEDITVYGCPGFGFVEGAGV